MLSWLENEPRFATVEGRRKHSADLAAILSEAFARKDYEHWRKTMAGHGITFGVISRPQDVPDDQRWLQARAAEVGEDLLEERWLIFASQASSVPLPFLTMLVFWIVVTFTCFGLYSPRNTTVLAVLFLCALSVAAAIFLVLEMDGAFSGFITVSPEPLEYAVAHMAH